MTEMAESGHAKWGAKLMDRRAEAHHRGEPRPCECWDCLRRAGITPPLNYRDRYKRIYPPQEFGVDIDGHPVPQRAKSVDDDGEDNRRAAQTAEERSHLRSALRNREAI